MQPIIIKNRHVRLQQGAVHCPGAKRVELLSDGPVVHAIELHCSCGETTLLELDYGPAEASSAGEDDEA